MQQLRLTVKVIADGQGDGTQAITNSPRIRQECPGGPDSLDGSEGTSYALTQNYALPVAQPTGCIADLHRLLCIRHVVMYMHHPNDMCITLFAEAPVTLWPLTQFLMMFMPPSG